MGLDKTTLKNDIKAVLVKLKKEFDKDSTPEEFNEAFAQDLADAIDKYIKTAEVNTNVSVEKVTGVTVGVGESGSGTGTGTGTLS